MALIFDVDWDSGTQSTTTYTQATPEVPNGGTLTLTTGAVGQVFQDNDSPWNGKWCCNLAATWDAKVTATLSASTWSNNSGRFLFQMSMPTTGSDCQLFRIDYNNLTSSMLRVKFLYGGGSSQLEIYYSRDAWAQENKVTFDPGTIGTTTPQNIEVIYDPNNSTGGLRLRARHWDIGGTVPSFTDANYVTGPAGTPANQYTVAGWGDGQNSPMTGCQVGRILHSNSISDDLSAYVTSSTGIAVPWIRA